MELKAWIFMGICSFVGAGLWCLFYYFSARACIRQAEKNGRKPKLTAVRIVYLTTGIIGQVIFWYMMWLLSEFAAMR